MAKKDPIIQKFQEVFGRTPDALPDGMPLEEKVNQIGKGNTVLQAQK